MLDVTARHPLVELDTCMRAQMLRVFLFGAR
jgi:hypothetical protein